MCQAERNTTRLAILDINTVQTAGQKTLTRTRCANEINTNAGLLVSWSITRHDDGAFNTSRGRSSLCSRTHTHTQTERERERERERHTHTHTERERRTKRAQHLSERNLNEVQVQAYSLAGHTGIPCFTLAALATQRPCLYPAFRGMPMTWHGETRFRMPQGRLLQSSIILRTSHRTSLQQ